MKNPLNVEFKMLLQLDAPDFSALPGVGRVTRAFRRIVFPPASAEAKTAERGGKPEEKCEAGFTLKTTFTCDQKEREA
ncbi:MAG: hypothetical protein V2A74_03385 [bacterium]